MAKPKNISSKVNDHDEDDKRKRGIKKTGKFEGKSNKLGGGGRFKQLVAQGKSPALAAYIGRKKYGAKKMGQMAAKGKAKRATAPTSASKPFSPLGKNERAGVRFMPMKTTGKTMTGQDLFKQATGRLGKAMKRVAHGR